MHPNTISVQDAVVNAQMDVIFFLLRQRWGAGYTQILNMTICMAAGFVERLLNCYTLYSCFSIDNRRPKHVILPACQMCSQTT